MSLILGVAGATRNAALALCNEGRIVGVCERERVTRTRRAALGHGQLPAETLNAILQIGKCGRQDIGTYAIAESAIRLPESSVKYVDHHYAHAATAFYSSPYSSATILVCDRRSDPELTVWAGDAGGIAATGLHMGGTGVCHDLFARRARRSGSVARGTNTGSKRSPVSANIDATRPWRLSRIVSTASTCRRIFRRRSKPWSVATARAPEIA